VAITATSTADKIGSPKVANMVMLGAYVGLTNLFARDDVVAIVRETSKKPALLEMNLAAFDAGMEAASRLHADEDLWAV
jgi:Pyruvate/2-oxoacid:ferredoxin oxidoreductase gamma subunit